MSELTNKVDMARTLLEEAVRDYTPVVFANSLGAEDMVLTDLIVRNHINIEMFSLDTGRLPQETYDLMQKVGSHYKVRLGILFPDARQIEEYVIQNGINGFYGSPKLRKSCCNIRKLEPLRRALSGRRAWITGVRREQTPTRGTLDASSFDIDNGLQKFNPLLEWSNAEIWEYINQNGVPYNKLHDHFYPSIGCAPCTRAITPGEDIRSGRWWWEDAENQECGLHVTQDKSAN